MNFITFFAGAVAFIIATAPVSAATLLVDDEGVLIGATGVTINGSNFSVSFFGGECADAFGVCGESAFAFDNESDALAAAQALLDQVFIDSADGNFDTATSTIRGCTSGSGFTCFARIPFDITTGVFQATVANTITVDGDSIFAEGPFALDNGPFINLTFAVFAPEIALPAALPLFVAGLGGLALARRKNRIL